MDKVFFMDNNGITYASYITEVGAQAIAEILQENTSLHLSEMAISDDDTPITGAETELIGEKHRQPLSQLYIKESDQTQVIAETDISAKVGGWVIRKVAVFDNYGRLIVIARVPDSNKPILEDATKEVTIRVPITVDPAINDKVVLLIDHNIVKASRDWVQNLFNSHVDDKNNPHEVTAEQVGAAKDSDLTNHINDKNNPHQVTAEQVGAAKGTDLNNHINDKNNPHEVTAEQVGAAVLLNGYMEIYVPRDFASLTEAVASLDKYMIGVNGQVRIVLQAGEHSWPNGGIKHRDGDKITITGEKPPTRTVVASDIVSDKATTINNLKQIFPVVVNGSAGLNVFVSLYQIANILFVGGSIRLNNARVSSIDNVTIVDMYGTGLYTNSSIINNCKDLNIAHCGTGCEVRGGSNVYLRGTMAKYCSKGFYIYEDSNADISTCRADYNANGVHYIDAKSRAKSLQVNNNSMVGVRVEGNSSINLESSYLTYNGTALSTSNNSHVNAEFIKTNNNIGHAIAQYEASIVVATGAYTTLQGTTNVTKDVPNAWGGGIKTTSSWW